MIQFSFPRFPGVPPPGRKGRISLNFHLLEQYLDSLNEEYGIPALDLIVTKGHETVYRHAAGFSDPDGKRPVSPKDIYLLYSCTKLKTLTYEGSLKDWATIEKQQNWDSSANLTKIQCLDGYLKWNGEDKEWVEVKNNA